MNTLPFPSLPNQLAVTLDEKQLSTSHQHFYQAANRLGEESECGTDNGSHNGRSSDDASVGSSSSASCVRSGTDTSGSGWRSGSGHSVRGCGGSSGSRVRLGVGENVLDEVNDTVGDGDIGADDSGHGGSRHDVDVGAVDAEGKLLSSSGDGSDIRVHGDSVRVDNGSVDDVVEENVADSGGVESGELITHGVVQSDWSYNKIRTEMWTHDIGDGGESGVDGSKYGDALSLGQSGREAGIDSGQSTSELSEVESLDRGSEVHRDVEDLADGVNLCE